MTNQSKLNDNSQREKSLSPHSARSGDSRWILLIGEFLSPTEHLNVVGTSYIGWSRTPRGDIKSLAFKILQPRSIQTTTRPTFLPDYYYAILSPDGQDSLVPATTRQNIDTK